MKTWELSSDDLSYISDHGIDLDTFKRYRLIFERGKLPPELVRPCTDSDGIEILTEKEQEIFIELYERESSGGRCSKFVPASGAATRMFQCLCPIFERESINTIEDLNLKARSRPELLDTLRFFNSIDKLPFYPQLQNWCRSQGISVEEIMKKGPLRKLVHGILRRDGLGLGTLPKALLPFHRYGKEARTAFEEHILEAVGYVKDREGICRIHFTVSKDHISSFGEIANILKRRLAGEGIKLDISFSVQHSSTDTPAVDEEGKLLRDSYGAIVLRPGGHGALLKNLQECEGDIVFIKNVDNVPEDRTKPLVTHWKKVLGGMLIAMEQDLNMAFKSLKESPNTVYLAEEICLKWKQILPPAYYELSQVEKRNFLLSFLDRPKRVCGMVRNVGQPGGGPFWVKNPDGWITRQIIEKAQVDFTDPEQVKIWNASTHFNPVDVVCALRTPEGSMYHLSRFTDPMAYIITEKLHRGKRIRVLEHPGLWNGSMACWITVFVEVPKETFHPVKQITDLIEKDVNL